MTTKFYLPILDKPDPLFTGALNVNNVSFEAYNGNTPTMADALNTGAVKLVMPPSYIGAFSLAATGGNGLTLKFNSGSYTWPIGVPTGFPLQVVYSDIAWWNNATSAMDLFTPSNVTGTGSTTDVYSGGSGVTIDVKPLVWPVVTTTNVSVPWDGNAYPVLIHLARPLHISQNPTVTAGNIVLPSGISIDGAITAVKDGNNRITGWTFNVKASAVTTGSILLTLTDPALQYLSGGNVVQGAMTYMLSNPIGTISSTLTAPTTWTIPTFGPPQCNTTGANPGWLSGGSGSSGTIVNGVSYYGFAGWLTITGIVCSNVQSAFASAQLWGKAPQGIPNSVPRFSPFVIANMTPIGTPQLINGLYYQTYSATFDTGYPSSNFNIYGGAFNIGMVATNTSGTQIANYASQQYLNRNMTTAFTNWFVQVSKTISGVTTYYTDTGFVHGTGSWAITPTTGTATNGILGTTSSVYVGDIQGQTVVSDPALEYISRIDMLVWNTSHTLALVSFSGAPVRLTGQAYNPIKITPNIGLSATPVEVTFRLYPKSNYGLTPTEISLGSYHETTSVYITTVTNSTGTGGTGTGGWNGTGCVPAGTQLLMENGETIPIEQVQTGMIVATWDDKTLERISGGSEVINPISYENRELWELITEHGSIIASHDHRIFSEDIASLGYIEPWAAVRDVAVGQRTLWNVDSQLVPSTVISNKPTGESATVYHLSQKEGHIYCAGGLPAHNSQTTKYHIM